MVRCGVCAKEWTGVRAGHCTVCHQTFFSVVAFDRHQQREGCVTEELVPVNRDGVDWQYLRPGSATSL